MLRKKISGEVPVDSSSCSTIIWGTCVNGKQEVRGGKRQSFFSLPADGFFNSSSNPS